MQGSVRFHYDKVNDIHFAYPKWYVETEEDCRVWYGQFDAYFARLGGKVDAIIVLDDFRIGPKIGSIWGKYRAEWIGRYTRYSIRVRAEARVSTFNATSAAIHGVAFDEAPDVERAIELIHHQRSQATK
jgi:hypothetical protein